MKLSIVIPAHNEAEEIGVHLGNLCGALDDEAIDYEVLVVDDASADGTGEAVAAVAARFPRVRCVLSHYPKGFGFAVRAGLDRYEGDAVVIYMADGSDAARDVVLYYSLLKEGHDCVFGSRFMPGSQVTNYPWFKLAVNRVVNVMIRVLFQHSYNDTTNAFKAYRREVIDDIQPLISNHFNLTVEMPLKAIVRGHGFATVPISWTNRAAGESKLSLNEMGSRYAFIVMYVFLEHHLSRGDYRRPGYTPEGRVDRLRKAMIDSR